MIWFAIYFAGLALGAAIWTLIFVTNSIIESRKTCSEISKLGDELNAYIASR